MHPLASMLARVTGMWATKSTVPAPVSAMRSPHPYGLFVQGGEISASQAWMLYKNQSSFSKIVDLIADNTASLVPIVKVNGEAVEDHPVIHFLKRPGFNRTRQRLIKELAVQYLVTGTAYPHIYGNPAMAPIAIDVIKTKDISSFPGADNWPDSYLYAEATRSINFHRTGSPRDPRFFDSSQLTEIIPVYDMDGDKRGVGLSRLNSIRTDVELRLRGLEHNQSLLTRGARLSGVLSYKEPMDDPQRVAIQNEIRAFMTGSANAGSVLVTSGGESDFVAMSQNARDMDFMKLMESVDDAIAARYNVPITLFRTSAQTDNNYQTAWNVLYDQAVLPCFEVLYSGLAAMFSQRLGVEIEIEHDALSNPILARQAAARARELHAGQIISKNEARDIIGYEPVLGGDTILGPMGMVPIAEDMFTTVDVALGRSELESRQRRLAGGKPAGGEGDEKPQQPVAKPEKVESESRTKSYASISKLLTALANGSMPDQSAALDLERLH